MTSEQDTKVTGAAGRVEWLRNSMESEPLGAAEAAWGWIEELSARAKSDAAGAEAELDELFLLGNVPTGLNGPTDGILVCTTTAPAADVAVRALTTMWMPWQGKRFDNVAATGDNRLTKSTGVVGKLLWPLYSMRDGETGKLAFDFKTYVEAGKDDPELQVMVIDYANVASNPKLVIRSIRDELVEIVPGVFLGKILFNSGEKYTKIGFFALRNFPR